MCIRDRHGRLLFYSGAIPWQVTSSFCHAASDALIVTPEGSLVTCFEIHDTSHPLHEEFAIGQVPETTNHNSFFALPIVGQTNTGEWVNQSALKAFAEKEAREKAGCNTCISYRHCAGDCATRRTLSTDISRGRCHVNRELTKEILAWYIAAGGGVWNKASLTNA